MKLSTLLLLSIAIAPHVARADCNVRDIKDEHRAEDLRAFYGAHARPILRPEQRLPGGTAWRAIVDSVTGLAEPRITWMADRNAMRKANHMLETLHACRIMNYFEAAVIAFERTKEGSSILLPARGYYEQPPTKAILTYASARLVSTFAVILDNTNGNHPDHLLYGRLLDLEREQVVESGTCGYEYPKDEDTSGGVLISGLLEICSAPEQRAFEALWRKHVTTARALAKSRGRPLCAPPPELDQPSNRIFNVYVTEGGLAVYSGYLWPRQMRQCMEVESADDPVIIPWREVEPFLKPGPWRDELLKR